MYVFMHLLGEHIYTYVRKYVYTYVRMYRICNAFTTGNTEHYKKHVYIVLEV